MPRHIINPLSLNLNSPATVGDASAIFDQRFQLFIDKINDAINFRIREEITSIKETIDSRVAQAVREAVEPKEIGGGDGVSVDVEG